MSEQHRRGEYAHGRNKDERFIRAYDRGWQVWWFVLAVALLFLLELGLGFLGGWVAGHSVKQDDLDHAYRKGYRAGLTAYVNMPVQPDYTTSSSSPASTTTTTSTIVEPSPASPGSGAPAAPAVPRFTG